MARSQLTPTKPARVRRSPEIAWRRKGGELPRLDQLPIPRDVRTGPGWTNQMLEMADHIGAYAVLSIVARHGGEQIYVPHDAALSPFAETIDRAAATEIAQVYGGNRLLIPVARAAVSRARRAIVIAAVREKKITGAEAQKIIGTSRTYIAHLVNATDEGKDFASVGAARQLPSQPDLFAALPDSAV